MSTGFVLNIDDKLLQNLEKADELVQDIGKHSEQTRDMFNNAFQSMATGSLDDFVQKLMSARQAIQDIGDAKVSDKGLGSISTQAVQGADSVTTLVEAITRLIQVTQNAGNNLGVLSNISEQANNSKEALADMQAKLEEVFKIENKNVSNSAIAKLDEEIDKAMKRLMQLQQQLDYYTKGEGSNMLYPAGNVDPTAIDAEVSSLIEEIELLEQLRDMERARAEENLALASQIDAVNNQRLEQKRKERESERASAAEKSQRAKEINRQYEEADKEQRHRTIKRWSEEEKASMKAAQTVLAELLRVEEQKEKAHQAELKRIEREERDRIKSATELFDKRGAYSSLQDLQNYARELKRTMATLDPKSSEWEKLNKIYKQTNREIKSINSSMKDLNNTHKSLINTADQLKRAFALVFSVSQIAGYVKNIARVRGEFELQQRSLQAILQNKDEADRLWQQTIQLAVRSPFQVKELVTYTKQLAAYRVESDKLYDTTKMLADVSAGLGVDMNRLILAYGQVKAANYLRGTELRQFSEAGVNILAELAKYFTELEGRAISVGEVFERVSKRMVTFADVEEIFKRITSEGGVFYNMQEIQAETLKGQISNLRDAIDIMLNEIGKEGEGSMKKVIILIREMIKDWREVAFVLKTIIALYGTYKTYSALVTLGNSQIAESLFNIGKRGFSAANAMKNLVAVGKGLATLGTGTVIMAIVAAIINLARKATETRRKLNALNKELNEIYNADTAALKRQVNGFENLVNRLKDVNKGSREHKDIIGALNQNYGEYLGFVVDETTTYERLYNSITAVNTALTNKAKLNTYEKAYEKSLATNLEIINAQQEKIKKNIGNLTVLKGGLKILPTEQELNDWFNLFEQKVKNDEYAGDFGKAARDAFKEYGLEFDKSQAGYLNWQLFEKYAESVLNIKESEIKLQDKVNSLYGGTTAKTIEMRQELERINAKEKEELANAETRRQKEEILLKWAKARVDAEVKYEGLGRKEADKRIAALQKKSETIIDVNNKIMNSVDKLGSEYADMIYIDDEQATQGIDAIAKSAAESYEMQISLIKAQNNLKKAGTKYEQDVIDNATKAAQAYKYLLTILGRQDLLEAKINKENKGKLGTLNKQISALKEANSMYEKLKQTRDETIAKSDVAKAFNPLFSELGIANITENMDFTKSGIYKVLQKLPNIAGKKGEEALEKIKAVFKSQIDLDLKVVGLNDLKRQIDESFENYQLYVELKNLGIPKNIMESFFEDVMDFNELKEWAKEIEPNLLEYGDKGIEANKNMNEKILKMEREYAKERVKTYVKYLMEAQREAVKIKVEELRKLKEIEESKEFTTEQKEAIKDRIRKETNAELQKQEWADFQNSEMYTMMFEDLEHYGTQALETLREKLIQLKSSLTDLPASEVKEIINQLSKIEDITIERNPFRALKETRKQLKAEGVTEEQAQTNLAQSESRIAKLQSELDIINIVNTAKSKGLAIDAETQYAYDDIVVEMADMGVAEADIVKHKENSLKAENKNAQAAKKTLDIYERQGKARIATLNRTKDILGSVQDAIKASMELMDSFGVSTDSIGYTLAESTDSMISLTISAIEFTIQLKAMGIAANSALGIIGYIAIGIQAVATAMSAIFKMHDAGLQKQIDDLAVQTEDLQEKFDALSEAVDKAYSTDTLKQAAKDAEKYTKQMIANYEAMIELEKQKKKTDEEKIKEYEESIAAQREALEDLKQDMLESMGGVTDYRSATQDFVDAWVEAYKECGDGLNGLQDNFTEFFDNLIKQQATMKVTEKFLEPFYNNLNAYLDDYELTKDEMDKLREQAENIAADLSPYLEELWNILGGSMGETGGSLSGLQAGIQGISESQAEIISTYLNSLRFFVADNNSVMKQLRDYVIGTDDTANPMLAQLRIIAQQTSAMRTLLDSVTQSGHPKGQSGIRVFID